MTTLKSIRASEFCEMYEKESRLCNQTELGLTSELPSTSNIPRQLPSSVWLSFPVCTMRAILPNLKCCGKELEKNG